MPDGPDTYALGEEVWVYQGSFKEILGIYIRYEEPSGDWTSPCHLVNLAISTPFVGDGEINNYLWCHPKDLRHRYTCAKCDRWRMKDDYLCDTCRKDLLLYCSHGEVPQ